MRLHLRASQWYDRNIIGSQWIGSPLAWMWQLPLAFIIVVVEAMVAMATKGVKKARHWRR